MKWLILFPAWIFLLSYAIHRVREANATREDSAPRVETVAKNVAMPAFASPKRGAKAQPLAPREPLVNGDDAARLGSDFARRVQLLPIGEGGESDSLELSPLWPIGGEGGGALQFAGRSAAVDWRLFEDSEISFYYPDIDGVVVESVTERPPMFGGIFFQSDTAADRWFVVRHGDGTSLAAFSIDREKGFDKLERYPREEVFHKLFEAGGGIARTSLTSDGGIGRVQWLGKGLRVGLLEWKHCSTSRRDYATIAASLRLADPLRDPGAKLAWSVATAGLEERIGMLEKGMGAAEVEAVIGRPVGIAGETWVYHTPDREGDRYYRLELVADSFAGLAADWKTVRKDPPIEGSVEWMLEKTEIRAGDAGGIGYDLGRLDDEEVEQIFAALRQRLPTAEESEWDDLCRIIANMAEMKLHDDACLSLLRSRFLEPGLTSRSAILALRSCDARGARDLFAQKFRDLVGDLRWKRVVRDTPGGICDDLRVMLAYVGEEHPEAPELVRMTVGHAHPPIRAVGFAFLGWMDPEDALRAAKKGVGDADVRIRRHSAEAFAEYCGTVEDIALLEHCLAAEGDPEAREHLEKAVARLEKEASSS